MPQLRSSKSTRQKAIVAGYRSGLEQKVSAQLDSIGVVYEYEPPTKKIKYTKPASDHKYTPDFILGNGIIVETKGRFLADDRAKHLLIKAQHPKLDIRFVFTRANASIGRGSKTTCADWCDKHGFQYAEKLIPEAWIKEWPK